MKRAVAREAVRLMDAHQPYARATVVRAAGSVPGKVGSSMIVRPDGSSVGTVGGAALEERVRALCRRAIETREGSLHHFTLQPGRKDGLPSMCGGAVDVAIEYVPATPNVLLWGGGHVSQAIARLLPVLEYDYSVADDRPEWITAERFPEADRRIVASPEQVWEQLDPGSFTHVYLLGYDAQKDRELLYQTLPRCRGYIGLIASETKRRRIFASLRARGVADAELRRVHSPIGLAIGAETPAEIAVSVVAEMVALAHPERLPTRARSRSAHAGRASDPVRAERPSG